MVTSELFESLAWLIPLLPLLACGVLLGWGKRLHDRHGDGVALIGVVAIGLSCVIALGVLASRVAKTVDWHKHHAPAAHAEESADEGHGHEAGTATAAEPGSRGPEYFDKSITWTVFGPLGKHLPTSRGDFNGELRLGYRINNLTAAMLAMVTFIAMLIQIYSMGYMHGDERYSRFFAYMSLFCFSMLLLVLANNFLLLFAGWELVGLCSYLLIGFWFEKPSAAAAAKKAFIVNRIGDFGFLIGLMVIFFYCPTLDIDQALLMATTGAIPTAAVAIAGLGLFCGAIGKSAQFPLHVWLPDAMEGPTPVSALIHAATMVAAGVYMVARVGTLYEVVPSDMEVVRYIGIITALMAATIGVAQNDIKRVLAYSTVSQLGFMVFALGMGAAGWVAGVFHLLTHAFFKALLFLGSGSVIHGCGGEQDMTKMGGLRKSMPVTFWTFLMGTLALTGVPFLFSGFWSKDEIMAASWSTDPLVFWLGELAAFFTAFYMGRLIFLTFAGDHPRDESIHPHESPKSMTVPLILLAIFAVGLGWLGMPGEHNVMGKFLAESGPLIGAAHHPEGFTVAGVHFATIPLIVSIMAAGLGWLLAAVIWGWKIVDGAALKRAVPPLAWAQTILANKYYFDELYDATFVRGTVGFANACGAFDRWIVDGAVNVVGWFVGLVVTAWTGLFDNWVVDGLVNLVAQVQIWMGRIVTLFQTGRVQHYLAYTALTATLIIAIIVFVLGWMPL